MFENMTKGERFVLEWQYRFAGHFKSALVEAILRADNANRDKLRMGFPEEVEAVENYKRKEGWWQEVQKRSGVREKLGA